MLSVPGAAQRPSVHRPETPARAWDGVRGPAGRVHAGRDRQVSGSVCAFERGLFDDSVSQRRHANSRQQVRARLKTPPGPHVPGILKPNGLVPWEKLWERRREGTGLVAEGLCSGGKDGSDVSGGKPPSPEVFWVPNINRDAMGGGGKECACLTKWFWKALATLAVTVHLSMRTRQDQATFLSRCEPSL